MEIPCSQESQETLIMKFGQAVDLEYSKQNSTPTPPKWSHVRTLISHLKRFLNVTIVGNNPRKLFISDLLKYVELVMGFLSSYEDSEYRKQLHYASSCLAFIPDIFKDVDFRNTFVQAATVKMLDLFTYGDFNLISKRTLLSIYNEIAMQSKKLVRQEIANSAVSYMYKLLDCLSTYGDYVIQSDVMETLFRIFGKHIRDNKKIAHELLPGSEELGAALTQGISVQQFDTDVRKWLNKFNQDSPHIFSIACRRVKFGSHVCLPLEDIDKTWVDFNLIELILSFYCQGSSPDRCNRLIVLARDVKKVEVKRPLGATESTVSIQMSKSCISEDRGSQYYYDKQEKHLKLIISNEEKDKITKLITAVLPQVFGDAFSHTSAKISAKPRNVYKPLPIKISKRKSSASDVSIATSGSKSKSDGATTVDVKLSSVFQKAKLPSSVCGDSISITDITRSSHRSDPTLDHISIITSDNLDILPSSKPTSQIDSGESDCYRKKEKVQDNNITSSLDDKASPRIEILSGRCSGRSADYQRLVHEGFHASDVFSSSPVKISQNKNSQDIAEPSLQEDEEQQYINQKENMKDPKISCLKSQEEMLDEEFETAVENIENEMQKRLVEGNRVFHNCDAREDISELKNQIKYSKVDKGQKDLKTLPDHDSNSSHSNINSQIAVSANDDKGDKTKKDKGGQVEELQMEYSVEHKSPDKHLNKSLDVGNETLSTTDGEAVNQMATESTSSNIAPISDKTNVHCEVLLDKENEKLFTEDLDEVHTLENKNLIDSEEVSQERNSEDIFSRPTELFLPQKDQNTEQFNDVSLVVNVGISDRCSEDVQNFAKEVFKQSVQVTKEHRNKEEGMANKKESDVANVGNKDDTSRSTRGVTEENIIDLTQDDDNDDDQELGEVVKKRKSKHEVKKKEDLKKVVASTKTFFNTPELLDILDEGNPLEKSLKEMEQNKREETTDDKVTLGPAKESCVIKEPVATKENRKTRKKKPRTLIKTGKKRFDFGDDVKKVQTIYDGDKNEEGKYEKLNLVESSCTQPAAHLCEKENIQTPSDAEENTIQETGAEQFSKKTEEIKTMNVEEMEQNKREETTDDKVTLGPAKESCVIKEPVATKEKCKTRKKKPRTLIKTEKKRFDLKDDVEEVQTIHDGDKNEKLDPASCTQPATDVSEEENIQTASDPEKNTIQEAGAEKFNKKTEEIEMMTVEDTTNVPQQFNLELCKKQLKVVLTPIDVGSRYENSTSNSESELAPEINKENVDNIDGFDKLNELKGGNMLINVVQETDVVVKDLEKKTEIQKSSNESLLQEFQMLEEEIYRSYKNKSDAQKRKHEDYDEIVVERAPMLMRTRSSDKIKGESPDDFDKLAADGIQFNSTTFNKSKSNTTAGNKSRKLFSPGNFSYLEEMPEITERSTPELDDTPIAVVKGTRLTKQKRAQLMKEKEKSSKKLKTLVEKSKKAAKKSQTKPRTKRGKRKAFSFSTTNFMDLTELFNKTCRGLGNPSYAEGFDTHRPMDIAVRNAPQHALSDELQGSTSPVLPKYFEQLPSTPEYNSSDLEIEPAPRNKHVKTINIIQDIVIKPKRPHSGEGRSRNQNKRIKLDRQEAIENIAVPVLPQEDPIVKCTAETSAKEYKNKEDEKKAYTIVEGCLGEMITLQKDINALFERSIRKIKNLME